MNTVMRSSCLVYKVEPTYNRQFNAQAREQGVVLCGLGFFFYLSIYRFHLGVELLFGVMLHIYFVSVLLNC